MNKLNQDGGISGVAVSLIFCVLLLIGALGFAGWAFMGRQDYKNNADQKISAAVTVAKQQESSRKDLEFLEKEKNPLRAYAGPQAYGSVNVSYPKTWSGVVDDRGTSSSALVDAYFSPSVVPALDGQNSTFALRFKVSGQPYSQALQAVKGLQANKQKPVTVTPYALPKVPNVVGMKLDGNITAQKTGTMVILPLRSQTLYIWTEGDGFKADFNNIILPNFTFAP